MQLDLNTIKDDQEAEDALLNSFKELDPLSKVLVAKDLVHYNNLELFRFFLVNDHYLGNITKFAAGVLRAYDTDPKRAARKFEHICHLFMGGDHAYEHYIKHFNTGLETKPEWRPDEIHPNATQHTNDT
jgi:hypothetical protein